MSKRLWLVMFGLTGSLLLAGPVRAEQDTPAYLTENSALENTERNVRDKANTTLTPEDQKETKQDIKITARLRKALIRYKTLSVNAQNVKIITRNGMVTLRGPVESEAERTELKKLALHTPGVKQVDNQLEIKAP